MDEIKILITERNIDILCVSETWLLAETLDAHVNIPNFKVFRCDQGRGGGVCIYVSNQLKTNVINLFIPKEPGIEDVWVSVQSQMFPAIIVGCVYRHPKSHVGSFEYIQDVFRQLCVSKKDFYVLGDFNDDILSKGNKMCGIIKNNKLSQMIEEPTRVTPTSATLLDLIITNKPDLVLVKSVVPQVIADHDLISIKVNIRKPKRQPVTKTFRHLGKYTKDTLCELLLLEAYNLNQIMESDDVDLQINIFNDTFTRCLDNCAPFVTKEIARPFTPWFNEDLRQAIQNRNDMRKKLKSDRSNLDLQQQFSNETKLVKSRIAAAKKEYCMNRIKECRGDSSATWKIIKEIVPNQKSGSNNQESHFNDNIQEKVEEFNNFFANIGKTTYDLTQQALDNNNDKSLMDVLPSECNKAIEKFRPEPVDTNTVILTVKSLKETRSIGSDGISLQFIKDALCIIAFYLTCIINTSIVTGVFPLAWKHALVIPLFKNGDFDHVNNYRPISLLPILSKILEKIVSKQLLNFLENNHCLSKCQHGFRPNLSTETALTVVTDAIYNNMDNKKISLLTLCDLSKAFDSVSHSILLKKCSNLNIDPQWFRSYLTNRSQSVKLKTATSSKISVTYGVPQGSILGPILFNIYVNDMLQYITTCTLIQYADDTQFIHSGSLENLANIINDAEKTLADANEYFLKNGLMVNPNKTQCIFIGSRQLLSHIPEDAVIHLGDTSIRPSTSVKNLGLYMDRYMTFDTHINELSKKTIGMLIYISRVSINFDKVTRTIIVQSLVLSLINYCIRIWGTTNTTLIKKVQKLQNFAARVSIGGMKKYDHVSPALEELKWLKVKQKHVFDINIAMYKFVNGMYPDWLLPLPTVQSITGGRTRQKYNIVVPRTKTDSGAKAFSVNGPKTWNSLPSNVTKANTLSSFKRKLMSYILSNFND